MIRVEPLNLFCQEMQLKDLAHTKRNPYHSSTQINRKGGISWKRQGWKCLGFHLGFRSYSKCKDGVMRFAVIMWQINKLDGEELSDAIDERIAKAIDYFNLQPCLA